MAGRRVADRGPPAARTGQAVLHGTAQAENLSSIAEETTARTFDSVDIALAGLASYLAAQSYPRNDASVRELMRSQLKRLPVVRAFFVIGPDGWIRHDTDSSTGCRGSTPGCTWRGTAARAAADRWPPARVSAGPDALVGKSYAELPMFSEHLPHRRQGVYVTKGPPLGHEHIVSYAALRTRLAESHARSWAGSCCRCAGWSTTFSTSPA